ncbi:hypothetical protein [Kitasatospora griseola]|uniref:hypothetical protein n=1 Tax=Kitasatospora griseola TaxID=2064 RepID=UPI00128DC3A2|nr:hypothetical protein [Kitasatospora griseola]
MTEQMTSSAAGGTSGCLSQPEEPAGGTELDVRDPYGSFEFGHRPSWERRPVLAPEDLSERVLNPEERKRRAVLLAKNRHLNSLARRITP